MLQENVDYYINEDGNFVFTKEYHLKRGYCCKNKCLHCPWNYGREDDINGESRHLDARVKKET
ncbi:hypothetical protein GWR56_20055 [Mucilaginibacter sp. 14171R-50]|uniref:DUF5522 domain-containing protein n=1 Tax=Mucilaginibacter sp. 14171R-50 TaxID=2703789 RepID=UPI00138BA5E2|nr:DUF5522 domain-containing protein [Mucilaginibacter sp. 14171R-50]QHS57726.1 hypothetical protein GWR56_20055 [Mucilaginibacter sp. 14171R-50]